jgi:hypothetical protein
MEECHSKLERPVVRICNLLLGPPTGRARLADRLDKAAEQLSVELAAQWGADAKLEAMWILTA